MLISGKQNLGQVCANYKVSSSAALKWKNQVLEKAGLVFNNDANVQMKERDKREEELYAQIGKLQVRVDFLKKLSL
jgi:hypothetical protein